MFHPRVPGRHWDFGEFRTVCRDYLAQVSRLRLVGVGVSITSLTGLGFYFCWLG